MPTKKTPKKPRSRPARPAAKPAGESRSVARKKTARAPQKRATSPAPGVAQLAEQLRQGELSPAQALLNLIDQIIARHRRSGTIKSAVDEQKLRQLLAGYAEHDPIFAKKIRTLASAAD